LLSLPLPPLQHHATVIALITAQCHPIRHCHCHLPFPFTAFLLLSRFCSSCVFLASLSLLLPFCQPSPLSIFSLLLYPPPCLSSPLFLILRATWENRWAHGRGAVEAGSRGRKFSKIHLPTGIWEGGGVSGPRMAW
jgi:hypothetical protein